MIFSKTGLPDLKKKCDISTSLKPNEMQFNIQDFLSPLTEQFVRKMITQLHTCKVSIDNKIIYIIYESFKRFNFYLTDREYLDSKFNQGFRYYLKS